MARQQNASHFDSFGIHLSCQTGNIVATLLSGAGPLQGQLLPCAVERIGLRPIEAHEHQEWPARCGQPVGCTRSKPSQGSVPAGLTLASDFSFCFQCKVGSSLVLRLSISAVPRYACQFCQYRASRLEHTILRVLRNLRRGPRFAQTSSRS
jgi:hypothetical protein